MRFIKHCLLFIAAVAVAVFAVNNKHLVEISLYPFPAEFSVAAFILFFGIAGALLADEQVKVDSKSVLVIDLSKRLSDRKIDDPFAELSGDETYPELSSAVKLIKHAPAVSSIT